MVSESQPRIPVIDFSKEEIKPGAPSWLAASKQVCHALEEYGCFIAEYDEVSPQLHGTIFDAAKELYDLPIETKKRMVTDKPFRGYFSANPVHEGIGIDNATTLEGTKKFTNLMWPNGNHRFSENVHEFAKLTQQLDRMVIKMVFEKNGVEKHYEAHVGSMEYVVRFSKYNKEAADEVKNRSLVGLAGHTDKTFTTILHQSDVNGLEIQTSDGEWIVFDPQSHTSFLYLAGDAFKVWSNGRIRPCYHRLRMSGKEAIRYSVGLFTFYNGVIQVPEEFVDEQHPLRYKPFDHLAFLSAQLENAYRRHIDYSVEAYCGI